MNRIQGINSIKLCSLAGRYDNLIPTRFLASIDCLKIPAQSLLSSLFLYPLPLLQQLAKLSIGRLGSGSGVYSAENSPPSPPPPHHQSWRLVQPAKISQIHASMCILKSGGGVSFLTWQGLTLYMTYSISEKNYYLVF
jgi:hypothetical protein